MSEQLNSMLERAVHHSPGPRVTGEEMLAAGRARVRRRRAVGAGSAIGAFALAGVVWVGLGGGSLGPPQVSPASLSWEVDDGQTLTVLDHTTEGGLSSVVVSHSPAGPTATLVVDGREESVVGQSASFGATEFVSSEVTVLVWDQPASADAADVVPMQDGFGETGPVQEDDDLWYAVLAESGPPPQDLLFHDSRSVWTASGQIADTRVVADGPVEKRVFWLEGLGLAGVLDDGLTTLDPGWSVVGDQPRPWWRGGGSVEWVLARLPEEATRARLVSTAPGQHVSGEPIVDTVALGDSTYALAARGYSEVGEGSQYAPDLQWSVDGESWRDREAGTVDPAGLGGVDLHRSGADVWASRDGRRLQEIPDVGDGLWAWRDVDDDVVLVSDATETQSTADLQPIVRWVSLDDSPVSVAPQLVTDEGGLELADDMLPALKVDLDGEELVGAVMVDPLADEPTVQVLGGEPSDPALPHLGGVQVSAAAGIEHWAVWTDAETPVVVDGPGLRATQTDDDMWSLVARLPEGATDPVLVPADESMTVQQPLGEVTESGGVRWWSLPLQAPGRPDLREVVDGLDTDGDGTADLPVTEMETP
ncbi:hypothetical protein AVL62_05690 [Serinicoccus chungangensis]|uniref:Uncharacterized protein n=1 Tax=Serinicoccus chungangensis TaxID=767452 RepID=A0A0W8I8R6_9MICO|nr:hypothetical protein [Serinicoccus chungangensis]KUG55779.1 hypothetical protein AVL62_05690 [Serinicoccus chungangensis]